MINQLSKEDLYIYEQLGEIPKIIDIASEGVRYRLSREVSEYLLSLPRDRPAPKTALRVVEIDSVEAIPSLLAKDRKERLLQQGWYGLWYRCRFSRVLARASQFLLGLVIDWFDLAA
ncbi:hypothetical protein QZJ86_12190 [Methylomonas montana]|uniref:hypothetical protein n=1 Tax=Methylomonas montana TaxID=3058963 RepID=UPI002658B407|nr:hypothetical protein [Methylomonas montana]WKJ88782.1 hypothetical protein QZJ86_12190 [Methylomonas montana]